MIRWAIAVLTAALLVASCGGSPANHPLTLSSAWLICAKAETAIEFDHLPGGHYILRTRQLRLVFSAMNAHPVPAQVQRLRSADREYSKALAASNGGIAAAAKVNRAFHEDEVACLALVRSVSN